MDGDTVAPRILRSGRPVRVDEYDELTTSWRCACAPSASARRSGAPIVVAGRLWGAVIAASGAPTACPPTRRSGSPASRS